ncbi:MAG: EAL domain-containing protein [Burkholderiales bacterium]|nr:EAL domain-containing protein [Burkholderiales bacterium]
MTRSMADHALGRALAQVRAWFHRAHSEPGDLGRVRSAPPVLRPLAAAVVAVITAMLVIAAALLSAWQGINNDLERRVEDAARHTALNLAQVSKEMAEVRIEDCSPESRELLARQSFASTMVRQFFVEFPEGEVCSPLGPVFQNWPSRHVTEPTLFRSDRLGGLVLRQPHPQGVAVALISPRQIVDRLGENTDATFALRAPGGWTMVDHKTPSPQTGMEGTIVSRPVPGWPFAAEAILEVGMLRDHIGARAGIWISLWVLAFIVAISGANALLALRSSRRRRLQVALRKRRFVPVVQPIVDSATGACVGVEVLMRWKHPVRGLIAPVEFIDFAERSGLIVPMSDLVMRLARDQLAEIATLHPGLYFSFNVTPAQLRRSDFCDEMLAIFDGDPIGPARVLVELTERDLIDEQVRTRLDRLRASGFRIAIDDFGTGQSSLALLQNLAIDRLKIDREFVRTIGPDADRHPVLDAIVGLSHSLRIPMIAEGIETPAQRDYLVAQGVQTLQGYLFARPMAPLEFGLWLAERANNAPAAPVQQPLNDIMQAIRSAPGLLANRMYHLRRYPTCLVGSELTSWLAQSLGIPRSKAVRIGQRIVARGWLVHVAEEHDFEDGPYFCRIVSQQTQDDSLANANAQVPEPAQVLGWLKGPRGVSPGSRANGLLMYRGAVNGHEIVQALTRCADLSQERAFAAARRLLRSGLLRHVNDDCGFEDSRQRLYTFT